MKGLVGRLFAAFALALLSGAAIAGFCHPVSATPQFLGDSDVDAIVERAALAAQKISSGNTTIAVVDRVGNVLGVFRTTGNSGFNVLISSRSGVSGGLDGVSLGDGPVAGIDAPDAIAAIAKAVTGAYLSSSGNAFSTRTASFIVQKNFIPTLRNFPSGPLFGVQFSQLPCGDFVVGSEALTPGPHRSPLGLSADPGGFPLYKLGQVVGGIGVVVEGSPYSLDLNPINLDSNADVIEERIAQSAAFATSSAGGNFAAPTCIRADRITAGGFNLRYSDSDGRLVKSFNAVPDGNPTGLGAYISVTGYIDVAARRSGTSYGTNSSGYVSADALVGSVFDDELRNGRPLRGMVLVDDNGDERFAPIAGTAAENGAAGLTQVEVTTILQEALGVANQARAQIRRPLNSSAEVTISVVDTAGVILGLVRTPDAPVFGTDVSVQKARTAMFFSSQGSLDLLAGLGVNALGVDAADYTAAAEVFFGLSSGADEIGKAITPRALGNVHRPNFPDGIIGKANGPFSTPVSAWSPFNVGLQLDIAVNEIVGSLNNPDPSLTLVSGNLSSGVNLPSAGDGCTGIPQIPNGIQIFPGAVPIYRGNNLVGAIGISGDGVDQDDMIAALGLHRAFLALGGRAGTDPGHAPRAMRSDRLSVPGPGTLRYVQCPQSPFVSSQAQNVCNF